MFTLEESALLSRMLRFVGWMVLGVALAYAPRPRTVISWFKNPQIVIPAATGSAILGAAAIIVLVHTSQLQGEASASALIGGWVSLLG